MHVKKISSIAKENLNDFNRNVELARANKRLSKVNLDVKTKFENLNIDLERINKELILLKEKLSKRPNKMSYDQPLDCLFEEDISSKNVTYINVLIKNSRIFLKTTFGYKNKKLITKNEFIAFSSRVFVSEVSNGV